MALVYVALGTNLGDRGDNIKRARQELAKLSKTVLIDNAPVYETRPVGGPAGQENYYNSACLLETALEPMALLAELQKIERGLGRMRGTETRWGPRVIDLDIVLWDDRVIEEPKLVVPHPRMAERAFVLKPLSDLDRDLMHPVLELTVLELLERTDWEHEGIQRISV